MSTSALTIIGEIGAAAAGFAALGTETAARAFKGVEKTVGQYAEEGRNDVRNTLDNADKYFEERDFIVSRLIANGCERYNGMVNGYWSALIALQEVLQIDDHVCRKTALAAGMEYWKLDLERLRAYSRAFFGSGDMDLAIAVRRWKVSDERINDDRVSRNTPLIFKGGISFYRAGWHLGGWGGAGTYLEHGSELDTGSRRLAKALRLKYEHMEFERIYHVSNDYHDQYQEALKGMADRTEAGKKKAQPDGMPARTVEAGQPERRAKRDRPPVESRVSGAGRQPPPVDNF